MKVASELMSYLVKDKHFSLYSVCGQHTYYKQCKELDSFIDNSL